MVIFPIGAAREVSMALGETESMLGQGGTMTLATGYAQPLRAIGQALEILNMQDFELEPSGDDFYVRGNLPSATNRALLGRSSSSDDLKTVWGAMPGENADSSEADMRRHLNVLSTRVELCYTASDVDRLEEAGRARRGHGRQSAEAYSVSQILRSIGAYLNQKRARLSKLSREIDTVVVEYQTTLGSHMKETLAIKDLYDLWVRMYLQRAERTH